MGEEDGSVVGDEEGVTEGFSHIIIMLAGIISVILTAFIIIYEYFSSLQKIGQLETRTFSKASTSAINNCIR